MKRSFFTPKRVLAFLVVLLVASSFLGEGVASAIGHGPRWVIRFFTTPLTSPVRTVGLKLRGEPINPHPETDANKSLDQLRDEKARLRREVVKLSSENEKLREENIALRKARQNWGLSGPSLPRANVTATAGDPGTPVLTIDLGTSSGVDEGTPVIYPSDNLVGRVVHAGAATSDVKVITAAGTTLMVDIVPSDADELTQTPRRATVRLTMREDGRTFVGEVQTSKGVEAGDEARLQDRSWPSHAQHFVVGDVISVEPNDERPNLWRDIIVRPRLRLTQLSQVTAIVPNEAAD